MKGKYRRLLTFLVAFSMILSMHVSFAVPEYDDYEGNDSYTYKEDSNDSSTWYFDEDGNHVEGPTDYWVEFTVSGDELSFETNNVSLDLLSIKGGKVGYRVYTNLGSTESGLTAPNNPSGKPAGISHYSFEITIIPIEDWEGKIIINKSFIGETEYDFDDVEFTLTGPDEYEETKSPDSEGYVEFTGLEEGSYTLSEKGLEGITSSLPENGLLIDLPDDADENDEFEVDVTNTVDTQPWAGKIIINKSFVAESDYDFDDVEFTLSGPDDYEETKSPDSEGYVEFTGLMEGSYTLSEKGLEGITSSLPENGLEIDLPDDADEFDVFEVDVVNREITDDEGSLTVHKRIMKENGSIVGALGDGEFTVTLEGPIGEEGSTLREKTIKGPDESGEHVIFNNLPFGTYILMETEIDHEGVTYGDPIYATSGNQNYELVDNENIIIGLEGTEQVWIINVPEEPWEGSIKVEKFFDGEGEYDKSGIDFTLTGPDDYEETLTTGEEGIVEFTGLPEGTYTLTEDVPSGFTTSLPEGGLEIVLPDDADEGNQAEIEVTNTEIPEDWTGNIRVIKSFTDQSDPEKIKFTLTGPDDFEQTKETDMYGEVEFYNLPEGEYTLTEDTREGYISSLGEDGMDITLPGEYDWEENDGYMFVYVTNRPVPEEWEGAIRIVKSVRDSRDSTPELDGFTFRLYQIIEDEEVLIGSRTTGESGIVSFTDLEEGDYILYENNRGLYIEGIDSDGLEITLPDEDMEDDVLTIDVLNIRRYPPDDDDDDDDEDEEDDDEDEEDDDEDEEEEEEEDEEPEVESETISPPPVPQAPPVVEPEVEVVEEPTPLATLPKTGASDPTVFAGLGAALMAIGALLKRRKDQ
jgi:serine-aspartate repeat-containing protein C/D/E